MWLPDDPELADFVASYVTFSRSFYAGTLTDAEWDRWYSTQLRDVLEHVTKGSRFYQDQFAGVDTSEISVETLSELPFTTKSDLRERLFDVLAADLSTATFFYETTGTTGRATPCPRDAREVIASNFHVTESWRTIFAEHFGNYRPKIGLMGPTEVHSFGDTLGDVARNVGSCNAKIWPYSPVIGFKKALELMRDLELEVICCTPGVCLNLAKAAQHYGFDIARDFNLKLVFLTGEMCTPALAANINSLWDVQTYNILYGSQEAFVIAVACKNGNMHVSDPNYIVEILDTETNDTLTVPATGELCVTTLIPGVKPLVRYRTGDLVHLKDNDCGCELRGSRIDVVGRVLDRIVLNETPYMASDIESAVLTGLSRCFGYQIIIDTIEGRDHILVRLEFVADSERPVEWQRDLIQRFQNQFGTPVTVEVVDELDQVVSTGAFVSWKAARILDRRDAPGHEEQVAARMAQTRGFRT